VCGGVGADRLERPGEGALPEDVEAAVHARREDGVDVRVLEAGRQHPPGQVDDARRGPDVPTHLGVRADGEDAPVAHRDRGGAGRRRRVAVEHGGADEEDVCGA